MAMNRSRFDRWHADGPRSAYQLNVLRYVLWRLPLIFLLPISYGCRSIATNYTELIEAYYSAKIYPVIVRFFAIALGWINVSIVEPITIAMCIIVIILSAKAGRAIYLSANPIRETVTKMVHGICSILSLVGVVMGASLFLGDLNQFRKPFMTLPNPDTQSMSLADQSLTQLCNKLIQDANLLRKQITYIPLLPSSGQGTRQDFLSISHAFNALSARYPLLASDGMQPKIAITTWIMNKLNIGGLYVPLTSEVLVNGMMPYLSILSTTCHELAHQRGFLREDEAEYIGYLACSTSPEPVVRYAVTLQALDHAMGDLIKANPNAYARLWELHDATVKADRRAISEFYDLNIEPMPQQLIDKALKAQGHNQGLTSYSEMVRYLLALR